jgi:ABC-type transport system involved in multi-copper enzyme maturation permease subunit
MFWQFAKKDLYTNLVTSRFVLGFLLCLFLVPFTMVVSINDYTGQMRAYEMDKKNAEAIGKVRVYSALRPQIVRPPEPLSIFSNGISSQVGKRVTLLLGEKPMLAGGSGSVRENPLLNSFFSLDFFTILTIIMSLLAVLFTYDACSGEREKGTLKLVLANHVSRSAILFGKIVGVTLTFLPIMLFCYVLSAIIILYSPGVSFGAGEWGRIAVMFFVSILFFLFFMSMGLFVSTLFRSSITSIIVCLFLWVTLIFIIPNAAVYAARSFIKTETQENLRFTLADLDREFNDNCTEYRKTIKQPDVWSYWNRNGGGDGYMELGGCTRSINEFHRQMYAYSEPLRIVYADKKWILQKEYLDKLDRQRIFSEQFSLLSPSESFQKAVSALCRTDVTSYYRFMERTHQFREELIRYFMDKKIFSSFTYFTRQDPASFMTIDEIVKTRSGGLFKTQQEFSEWAKTNKGYSTPLSKVDIPGTNPWTYAPLDQSDVPKFRWEPSSLTGDMLRTLAGLAGLALGSVVLFFLSFVSFTRYDAR